MILWISLMFITLILLLLMGYPVAFVLGAVSLLFGWLTLGLDFFKLLPLSIWGIMTNSTLLAVPLFIFMGTVLDRSGIAVDLMEIMVRLCRNIRGGLALAVVIVGSMLAATTGIVGATVVTMGVIALPSMLKHKYSPQLATGVVAASGTLGQIIPPSIILILMGDIMGVPVGRLFMGAVIPSFILVITFMIYIVVIAYYKPDKAPSLSEYGNSSLDLKTILNTLLPPFLLIFSVLGSIFFGIASPTESAAVGAIGSLIIAIKKKKITIKELQETMCQTTCLTSMVFMILIGSTAFGIVFRGMEGDILLRNIMFELPGGAWSFILISMFLIFLLGFFLDFLQICFIVIPILTPIAEELSINILWFAVLISINLQTSFLTPPFGFSLFYLKAVTPKEINIKHIYAGITPFVLMQVAIVVLLMFIPELVTWLPDRMDSINNF